MALLESKVLTVKELADYLKLHQSTIYKMIKHHGLPAFRVGSGWRFNIEDIDNWRMTASKAISASKASTEIN